MIKRFLASPIALLALVSSALAQTKVMPSNEILANGDITFGNTLRLGKREGNKTIITPDTLQILGSGSTGDVSSMTVLPNAGSPQNTISSLLANRLTTRGNDITANPDESIADKIPFANTGAKHFLFSRRNVHAPALIGTTSIIRNTVGSGTFGPGAADFALLASATKDDYLKSTVEGEIDTQIIVARQGKKGDSTPLALDTQKVRAHLNAVAPDETGGTLGFEIAAGLVRPATGELYHNASVYGAFIESAYGPSKGAGMGLAARTRRGNWFSAFYAAAEPSTGTDHNGAPRVENGWDNLLVNDLSGAGDQSGINFRIDKPGRTFQGLPAARMSWGFDATSNAWTMRDENGNAERFRVARDGGGLVLTGQYTSLTLADPVTGQARGGWHRLTSGGNGTFLYQIMGGADVYSISPSGGMNVSNLTAGALTITGPAKLAPYTVATLPACNAGNRDAFAVVTDAANPTYRGTLSGGGAARTPVYCDGVSWSAH